MIYRLKSDVSQFCSFIEDIPDDKESIMGIAMGSRWRPLGDSYTPITLELRSNEIGRKNYQFDISSALTPFFVLSEKALDSLGDIFLPRGEILLVKTESKRKTFYGYYPTNSLSGCLDKDKSIYEERKNGFLIKHFVLCEKNITDEYLFTIDESISNVFVTERFRERVIDAGLSAFDFSIKIATS